MASTRTQHLTLVRPDGRLQPRRPYPPLSRLNGVRKGWRVPGVLTGTRRDDSPAFDRLDGGSSYQSKTPGTTCRPAHTPVGSKVWGRPFQRAAPPPMGPPNTPGPFDPLKAAPKRPQNQPPQPKQIPPPGTPNCPVCRELFRWFVESPRKVFCRCKEKGLDR